VRLHDTPLRGRKNDGANGRGKGISHAVTIAHNPIRGAANGIRVDAGDDIDLTDNVLKDIDNTELRIADGVRR
jgi:enolase